MSQPLSARIDMLSGHSRAIAYEMVEPLARLMIVARETCWGDLDRALLMMVITLRSSGHPEFKRLCDADIETRQALPGFGTNAQSLSDATGIPKESVRRKVRQLIEAGWVVRNGHRLVYSAEGYRAVAPVREAVNRMYARGFDVIKALEESSGARAVAGDRA